MVVVLRKAIADNQHPFGLTLARFTWVLLVATVVTLVVNVVILLSS